MKIAKKILDGARHTAKISAVLWELDPMRTGCKGDATMQDEYEVEAQEIASLIGAGSTVGEAVVHVFDKWFWEDCLTSSSCTSHLDTIVEKISKITC